MANTLRIKRRASGAAGAPTTSQCVNAELAFNEVGGVLYYGKGGSDTASSSVVAIGGENFSFLNGVTAGTPAASKALVLDSSSAINGAIALDFASGSIDVDAFGQGGSGGTATFDGATTFNAAVTSTSAINFSAAATVIAGTNTQGQGALTKDFNVVTTTAASPSGVTLPAATTGRRIIVVNKGTNAVNVYPGTSAAIDALSANAAIQIPVNGVMQFNASSASQWYSSGNSTFSAPALGTPASGTLTNCTGLPISTGVSGLGTGVATFLATPTSANLATALTNETGTAGSLVFSASPTFTGAFQHNYSSATIGEGYAFFNLYTVDTGTSTSTAVLSVDDSGTVTIGGGSPTLIATNVRATNYQFNSATTFTAGTNAQGQGVLSAEVTVVTTTAANPSGVTLPTATSGRGRRVTVINKGTNPVNVYPTTGGTIDGGSANAAYSIPVNSQVTFFGTGAGIWYSLGANTILSSTALGTPSSGTLTNCTGLPISTGVSGLGTSVATFLATPSSANFAAALTDETGSSSVVFSNSPTLVTPNIGTPSAGTLTSCTGLPISTGVSGLGTGVATFLATPSSANLISAVTDETGSGSLVFATSPTLVTPVLGTPSSGTLTSCTGLPISTGVSGLGTGVATFLATPSSANLISAVTDETGSGSLVFGTSPAFTTSVTTASGTFAVFNTNATTVNAFGAATTLSVGASSGTTTINNNLTVTGNLTISGTTTTVNSTTTTIKDPIIVLGGSDAGAAAASDDNKDRGITFQWHNGTASKLGFFGYDDSASVFTFIQDATNTSEVMSGTAGDVAFGKVNNVTITTPASAATLTLGSGKTVTVSNTLTFTGTDSSSVAFGAGGTVAYTGGKLSQFAATTSSELAGVVSDETGTGVLVFGTSPAFTTSVTTGSASFDVFNTTATTVNAFGAATTLSLGATTGTTTVKNDLALAAGKSLKMLGSTSGTLTIAGPATAGTNTITFPAETGTVLTTASTSAMCTAISNCTLDGGTF